MWLIQIAARSGYGKGNRTADAKPNATQVFTVDKARLTQRLGKVTPAQLRAVEAALRAVLEL